MKKIIPALLLLALFMGACHSKPSFDATGIFEATTVTVSAETAGKLLFVGPDQGDTITQGEMIAVVDTSMYVLQLRQLESQLKALLTSSPDIDAQAAALRTRIEHQRNECNRQQRLLADGATTQKNYDDAMVALHTLQAELTALLSTLDKNRGSIDDNAAMINAQIDQIELMIDKSVISAPLASTVLLKYVEPGEYVVPGKPLVKLANLNDIYLRSYFTASQLADIKIGQQVTVVADFGGDEQFEYPGIITWIAEESEFTPKSIQTNDSRANLVYAVKIAVKNDGRLKLGQYGEVRL